MNSRLSLSFLFFIVFSCVTTLAQPPVEQVVNVLIAPDHADWEYKIGEKALFTVTVLKNGNLLRDVKIGYQVGPERMKPFKAESKVLNEGRLVIDGGTLQEPGFLRCIVTAEVDGKQYRNLATAGYNVLSVKPTVEKPKDFDDFWSQGKAELAKLPLDAKMVLWPEKSTALTNVYKVNLQNYGSSRLYGVLCVPKKEGKYPALLQVPGAGIRPYAPDPDMIDKDIIVLSIGIHGIPIDMDINVYNNLNDGALKGYFFFNADNKDRYYYKRVYLGCIRANDFIASLPQYNGSDLAVSGNSQGGALSIITASLDKRVKYLAAIHPALSDLTGYFFGRAGGWPHFYSESNLKFYNTKEVKETLPYYDVVNFARSLKTEGYYTWGFNDETCPPTSLYAAYNVISAPKTIAVFQDTGHWVYPEEKAKFNNWILEKLNRNKK